MRITMRSSHDGLQRYDASEPMFRNDTLIVEWSTNCPDCGTRFVAETLSLHATWPRYVRRRCDDCRSPGARIAHVRAMPARLKRSHYDMLRILIEGLPSELREPVINSFCLQLVAQYPEFRPARFMKEYENDVSE